MDDLILLYPEISRSSLSGAALESKYFSDKQTIRQIYELWGEPLIETLSSSYVQIYYLNFSDILKKCYWLLVLAQG